MVNRTCVILLHMRSCRLFVKMATPFSDSEDVQLYVLASQQHEQSVETTEAIYDEIDPFSPATEAIYDEMDEDDFMFINLLPPEKKYEGEENMTDYCHPTNMVKKALDL